MITKKTMLAACTCLLCIGTFTTCTEQSAEYKKLQFENDSLRLHIKKTEVEIEEMLNALNAIESDINVIRETEKLLNMQQDAELTGTRREQIERNMQMVVEALKRNKQQLAELQDKLDASNLRFSALQQTIDRLTKDVEDKTVLITKLQDDLSQRDVQIQDLTGQVDDLIENVEVLKELTESQSDLLAKQDKTLHTVYYCFGTKKELKEQNILSGGGLFSKSKTLERGFNEDYFLPIDKRRVTAIPLYASKATVKTNHPKGTFNFFKDSDGNLTLEINNPDLFWSLSKYLVIEVG